jgi:hypothetical protein
MTAAVCGHTNDMGTDDTVTAELRDDQQLRVVRRLRAAGGGPLDFEELRAMGIEHPAVVCYELEIAGVPIVQTRQSDRRLLALEVPAEEIEPGPGRAGAGQERAEPVAPRRPSIGADAARRLGRRAAGSARRVRTRALGADAADSVRTAMGRVRGRLGGVTLTRGALLRVFAAPVARSLAALRERRAIVAAWLALAIVAAAVVSILLSAQGGAAREAHGRAAARAPTRHARVGARGPTPPSAAPRRQSAPPAPAVGPSGGAPAPAPTVQPAGPSGGAAAPVRVRLADAGTLEREGHQLLGEGRYGAAIRELDGAVRASGQSLARCAEPTTEGCLTFAYALYDLGRALRLDGQSAAAIPVLSQRLRIDDQRPVVQHELELARGGRT